MSFLKLSAGPRRPIGRLAPLALLLLLLLAACSGGAGNDSFEQDIADTATFGTLDTACESVAVENFEFANAAPSVECMFDSIDAGTPFIVDFSSAESGGIGYTRFGYDGADAIYIIIDQREPLPDFGIAARQCPVASLEWPEGSFLPNARAADCELFEHSGFSDVAG